MAQQSLPESAESSVCAAAVQGSLLSLTDDERSAEGLPPD